MLEKYKDKRDFSKTPEPAPPREPDRREGRLMFVIQKHAATRLHYDFRLEVDGVLKSWPIPKGPSLDPKDKRLAVMTEDHPLDYASFEGVIPKGEYGGGQVIVWDAGSYSPDEDGLCFDDREEAQRQMREGIARGKVSVFLHGQKLKGSFTLVKTTRGENDWLFIKHKDRFVDPDRDVTEEDASILSGLTIADLKAGRLPDRAQSRFIVNPSDLPGAKKAAMPKSIEPMHGALTERPFSSADWYFEPKMDGVRAVAYIDGEGVRLSSRRGLDTTKQFPGIVAELATEQTERRMVLDGEIVALNEQGVPSFQAIQQRLNLTREAEVRRMESEVPVYYYVFDLLYAGGYDLRGARLCDRKALLRSLLLPSNCVMLLDHFEEDGEAAYEAAVTHGLEGVMAKKKDSTYEAGKRGRNWLKIKATREDDFIVGGYTNGVGGRSSTFGSLLVGQYDDAGKLVYSGNVGTGFDDRTLGALKKRLDALESQKSPFDVMTPGTMRFGKQRTEAEIKWVKPELVAVVKFAEWTNDGHLRAPSFLGLREDKAPKQVHREVAVPPPVTATSTANRQIATADPDLGDVLEQLQGTKERFNITVQGHKISVSNLDKEFWPEWEGRRPLTKRDLLVYFTRISPWLLPHLRDRPLTLTRYPNGITGKHFYQKHWESELPKYVDKVVLWSEQFQEDQEYLICNNLPALLWLGQLADIELHTWYSRVSSEPDAHELPDSYGGSEANFDASRLNYPDFIVFDLDPYIYSGEEKKGDEPELNRRAFLKTCDVAFWLKDVLDSLSLSSLVKTTGKTGLHIYVPILRQFDYDTVRAAAETVGKFLMRAHPRDITMEWATQKRTGKIFFDYGQNTKGKTLASIYSPRPVAWAGVSVPVRWDELRDIYPAEFTILNAPDRVAEVGDYWSNILNEKHDLGAMLEAVG